MGYWNVKMLLFFQGRQFRSAGEQDLLGVEHLRWRAGPETPPGAGHDDAAQRHAAQTGGGHRQHHGRLHRQEESECEGNQYIN